MTVTLHQPTDAEGSLPSSCEGARIRGFQIQATSAILERGATNSRQKRRGGLLSRLPFCLSLGSAWHAHVHVIGDGSAPNGSSEATPLRSI